MVIAKPMKWTLQHTREKTLKRIPTVFTAVIIMLLCFPMLTLTYYGFDFNGLAMDIESNDNLGIAFVEDQIRDYFKQILLQWSGFSLAVLTVLFSFTKYRITNDKIAFLIGLVVIFSGSMQALQRLVVNDLFPTLSNKENIDTILWAFSNIGCGTIIAIGLLFIVSHPVKKIYQLSNFIFWGSLFVVLAIVFSCSMVFTIWQPQFIFQHKLFSRPYELIDLLIFLIIIFLLYPRAYKKYPNLLTNCILYMCITQTVIALYLLLMPNLGMENSFIVVNYLKLIFYFIPFACLIINYFYSYNSILITRKKIHLEQAKLKFLASHDTLTDLYNRREFELLLDKSIANASRDQLLVALFLIDIDNFKSINDSLGHVYGDHFLKQFTSQLTKLTRKGDLVSRIGGDEFTIITAPIRSISAARKFAARLISGLNTSYQVDDKLLIGTISLGIAIYPTDGENTKELLKNADIAMYHAKRAGKNNFQFYDKRFSEEQHREAEIESYLRDALENNELKLHFQPQYDLITREIIGAEVLLRWRNKVLGKVSPVEFIPIAENSNLIIQLGDWVLRKTCEQASLWFKQYQRHFIFSINVSPLQFIHNNFCKNLKQIINEFDYPPHYLNIEITENLLMKSCDEVTHQLEDIHALGVQISLDDFGMGYSSLSRLNAFPISNLKIDKSFLSMIHNTVDKVIVVDTIIKLAHELGMTIIAEGIEREAQLNYLITKKCTLGQGFLLSKPLSSKAFEKLAYQ